MRRRFLAFTSAETSEEGGSYLEQRFNTRVPKFFGFRVSKAADLQNLYDSGGGRARVHGVSSKRNSSR
jgi:hypothetical protein